MDEQPTIGILFPVSPLTAGSVDEAFQTEHDVLVEAGFPVAFVDVDLLTSFGETKFSRLFTADRFVYRGWMLTPADYKTMFDALVARGKTLITTPENFTAAHQITGWVDVFENLTPATQILGLNPSDEEIFAAGENLESEAFIVKDFVKSRKHEWDTACYAANIGLLPDVVNEFIRLQEDSLAGGIVIREFTPLDADTPEVRVWWANTVPVVQTVHPDSSGLKLPSVPEGLLYEIKQRVETLGAPFVTTDVAQLVTGDWIVIEVGDAGVSGFPSDITEEQIIQIFTELQH